MLVIYVRVKSYFHECPETATAASLMMMHPSRLPSGHLPGQSQQQKH